MKFIAHTNNKNKKQTTNPKMSCFFVRKESSHESSTGKFMHMSSNKSWREFATELLLELVFFCFVLNQPPCSRIHKPHVAVLCEQGALIWDTYQRRWCLKDMFGGCLRIYKWKHWGLLYQCWAQTKTGGCGQKDLSNRTICAIDAPSHTRRLTELEQYGNWQDDGSSHDVAGKERRGEEKGGTHSNRLRLFR